MAYSTAVKNDRLVVVRDHVDAGSAAGRLKIYTAGMSTLLADIELADPSFDDPVAGQMSLAGVPRVDPSAAATGVAAEAVLTDSDGTIVRDGLTVGTSGANVVLPNVNIQESNEVRVESGLIAHG